MRAALHPSRRRMGPAALTPTNRSHNHGTRHLTLLCQQHMLKPPTRWVVLRELNTHDPSTGHKSSHLPGFNPFSAHF